MKVTMAHVRQTKGFSARGGLCARGVRAWCAANNVDYLDFLKNGVDEERVERMTDPFAQEVLRVARGK